MHVSLLWGQKGSTLSAIANKPSASRLIHKICVGLSGGGIAKSGDSNIITTPLVPELANRSLITPYRLAFSNYY
jgi:hypothetical protein